MLGLSTEHLSELNHMNPAQVIEQLRTVPGRHGLEVLFRRIWQAEIVANDVRTPQLDNECNQHIELDFYQRPELRTTTQGYTLEVDWEMTLPLPTQDQWIHATLNDPDLARVTKVLVHNFPILAADFICNTYVEELKQRRLTHENGTIFRYEHSTASQARQLRTKVVPAQLRRTIVAALHVFPLAGHSGISRTLFRVLARFWWPGISRDVREGVSGCSHFNLGTNISPEASTQLHTLPCDVPFDTVFLDIWSPGEAPDKSDTVKVLTCLDCMTGFAAAAFLRGPDINPRTIAMAAFARFFTTQGLPRLIIVNADKTFCSAFQTLFYELRVQIHTVTIENHVAVLNEHFHKYLYKVEKLNTDTNNMVLWKQGMLFAVYAWNASPLDGTDLPRSQAAIGSDFPFPIDLQSKTQGDIM